MMEIMHLSNFVMMMSKIIKTSFAKPDDPIYKEGFKTFTPKKSTKKKDKVEAEYDKTLPSCETERFDE